MEKSQTDCPELRFVGGCIVPVMFEPRSNLPILVLASETKRTRLGRAYNEWDAFGGRVEADESVEFAAAREFDEESMGLLTLTDCSANATPETIAQLLTDRKFIARVDLSYLRRHQPTPRFTLYTLFFVRANWDPDVPAKFKTLRRELTRARDIYRALRPPPVFSNSDALHFPIDGEVLPWLKDDTYHVEFVADASIIIKHKAHRRFGLHTLRMIRAAFMTKLQAVNVEGKRRTIFRYAPDEDGRFVRSYVDWVRSTAAARAQLASIPPTVLNHRAALSNRIQTVYLEKRCIRYMTVPQVLAAHGAGRGTLLPPGMSTAVTSRLQSALKEVVALS